MYILAQLRDSVYLNKMRYRNLAFYKSPTPQFFHLELDYFKF